MSYGILRRHIDVERTSCAYGAITAFGRKTFGTQIRSSLTSLCFQKHLQTKILIKNGIIPILNSVLKERYT